MRVSRYNRFTDASDGMVIAFNAMTGALASLSQEQHAIVNKVLSSPNDYAGGDNEEARKLREDLLMGGFLLEDSLDEISLLKTRSRMQRFQTSSSSVTIALTSKCNFRCPYCFEDVANGETAHGEVFEAIGTYVTNKIEAGLRDLNVTWFGGEPLLCMHSIEKLAGQFYQLCEERGCKYTSMIITNGYLLTREVAERLKAARVGAIQITIDGPEDLHDGRRFLANGKGSFRRIIENIKNCCDVIPIGIRVNVDNGNARRLEELLDHLDQEGLRGRVSVYFAPVEEYTDVTKDTCGSCMDGQGFSKLQVELERRMMEMGFSRPRNPQPRYSFCTADRSNSVVIGPDGSLYACYAQIGKDEEAIGSVFDGVNSQNAIKWLSWDPFEKQICSTCDVLPLCMGGCLVEGFKEPNAQKGHCEAYKYALDDHLRLFYFDWRLSLLGLAPLVPFLFVITRFNSRIRKANGEVIQQNSWSSAVLNEAIGMLKHTQVFHKEEFMSRRFRSRLEQLVRATIKAAMTGTAAGLFSGFFAFIGPLVVLWYGSVRVIHGALSIGTLVAFYTYLTQLYGPIGNLANINGAIQGAYASLWRVFTVLDTKPAVVESAHPIVLKEAAGQIEFRNVSFSYPGRGEILNSVSFSIAPGEKVAFVGPSGAGKTTIVDLLCRLYDPFEGSVLLSGCNLKDLELKSLRQQVA